MLVAKMFSIRAELISTRLLSPDDKKDLMSGDLPLETFVTAVKVWKHNGMPDYANGHTEPMSRFW